MGAGGDGAGLQQSRRSHFPGKVFTSLDDWGFDDYKFGGEHATPLYVSKSDPSSYGTSARTD
jgi:hypothetical protein